MGLEFLPLETADLPQYEADMQEAFQLGAEEGGFPAGGQEILPMEDILLSLSAPGAIAYKAVQDGQIVGGAIVVIDPEKRWGHLDFLYVKHGLQSKGVGQFMWCRIETLHPEIQIWETCTPYFEKRNIHFYVNKCGFHIVEFYHAYHSDPQTPVGDEDDDVEDEMFRFEKVMCRQDPRTTSSNI